MAPLARVVLAVGTFLLTSLTAQAVIPYRITDLGDLPGGRDFSVARGINDAGQVVGESGTASGQSHAFVWTAADGMVDLGTFVGATTPISTAQAINNAGQVVGASYVAGNFLAYHAALWTVCVPSPPLIADTAVSPSELWPPNHQMIRVQVDYTVTTSCGATATTALSVVSDEPDNGRGDGNSSGDAVVVDDHTVLLRAERAGSGDGRTYTIRIRTTDSEGHVSTATQTVSVPKNMSKR
jgi:probable HAF family extracellular repeat protein